jgi:hypothetical protein
MIVTILLISIVLLVVYVGSQRLSGLAMAAIFVIASGGIALVVSPQLASRIAQAIGVGRGTDLVLYVGVIGGLFGSAYFFVRMRRLERRITRLAQAIALREATNALELK